MTIIADLRPELRQYMASEFQKVAFRLSDSRIEAEPALYWYSAAFGAVQRVLNIQAIPSLVLLHGVLQLSHSQISA